MNREHLRSSNQIPFSICERRALECLELPASYELLPERSGAKLMLRIWEYPAFANWCAWAVIDSDDRLYLRRIIWDRSALELLGMPEPAMYGAEVQFPLEANQFLMSELAAVVMPPFANSSISLDGVISGVEFQGALDSNCRFQWYCDSPPEWISLRDWHKRAIESLEGYLPIHSAAGKTKERQH